ncbi:MULTISPECIES: ABC transporter ATP-binding protein [Bacteria]|uniref:ABC transporter ATP-binding protein n=1 Tax=Bacteria TaxID=2 RepID=UPI003C7AFA85
MIRTVRALLPAGSRGRVAVLLVLVVTGVVLRAAGAVVLVPLLGALFGDAPATAWPWVGVLAALTAAGWGVDGIAARVGFDLGFGVLDAGQRAVADRVALTRLTWFTAETTRTTRQAIAATGPDLAGLIVYLVTPLLSALLLPIAIAIALLPVSWPLALAALAGVPVLLGAFAASVRIGRAADREAAEANGLLTERILEFARTQHALRASRRVEPERSHVGEALARQHGASVRLLLMQVPGQLLFSVASQLALVLLAGTVVALTVGGQLTAAQAVALIVVVVRYLEPFTALAELSVGVEGTMQTLQRIRAVLAAPAVEEGASARTTAGHAGPGRVELRGVGFRYHADEAPVLDEVDLTLEPGTTTAVVGPSGSGKSTLLALLAGLHAPTAGSVLVDGLDVAALTTDARRGLVSMVFQSPYLFDGTVLENVRAGDPTASRDAVDAVMVRARANGFVDRLPEGGETRVGEAGSALSGGERQRLSIARALLKPAPVLLVDEGTSALDTENEAAVTAALADGAGSRTRVIVAHRLASIRLADRVVFLEEGRIVEDGTIAELREAGGRFAAYWREQHEAAGWRLGGKA